MHNGSIRPPLLCLFLILCLPQAFSYGIGITPDKLSFTDTEAGLTIINPNDFDVNYTIEGCDNPFIELLRQGVVNARDERTITLRINRQLLNNTKNCSLDLYFSNNFYSTGFSINADFSLVSQQETGKASQALLSGLFSATMPLQQGAKTDEKKIDLKLIIAVTGVFLIALFVIIRYL